MAKKIILSYNEFKKLNLYCKKKKIKFLSTAFDLKSINFLKKFNMDFFKIPSGEITNYMYLEEIGKIKKKVVLSTGMANLNEISDAIKILVRKGTKKKNITVMHCNTEYPTPMNDVNLKAMVTIKNKLKVDVGYSDHTEGTDVPPAAVALGASIIEKHVTLDKSMRGPDHKASLTEKELDLMVKRIRKTETLLGTSVKKITQSEKRNIKIARNSLVAKKYIKKGQRFSLENLTAKRPATGISPMKIKKIIGKKAKKNFIYDELIKI
jgi:N,N'-diacetyllegionaminate synthase